MRLFYAVSLDKDTQLKLYKFHNYRTNPNVTERIVPQENLHITLTFIGETEDITPHLEVMDLIKMYSFRVKTQSTMQYFKDTLVIALRKSNDIMRLKQVLDSHLKDKNLLPDKRYNYVPHITLARKTSGEILQNPVLDICVDKVVLYQSILNDNRVEYRIVKEVNLLKE